ncbi:MAG: hypothetical protein JNK58_04215 [Phycisphaerae bacterium]|nr:hypothetical protein [Phycisphaerae bacterium]
MIRLDPNSGWTRLDRAALAAPGNQPADAWQWTTRGGLVLIAIALTWMLITLWRPLDGTDRSESERPPTIPSLELASEAPNSRRELLARIGDVNLFDAEREAWSPRRRDEPKNPQSAETAEARKPPAAGTQTATIAGQTVQVTKAEALPEDVKAALTGLALRGIYTPPSSSAPIALISRVHAGPNPLVSDAFRAGDEFEDKQYPQAKWKVIAIDAVGKRVILQRAGINAVLPLYASSTLASESVGKAPGAAKPAGTSITLQSRQEVEAALREAKLGDEEIQTLLRLAEMEPDAAAAAAKLEAIARAEKNAPKDPAAGRRPPPPGLEAIAKMLQQTPKGLSDQDNPPPEPDAKPPESAEPK